MAVAVNCLVIAVDYGTTYTGVAFRPVTYVNGRVKADNTEHIADWPGGHVAFKTPSRISFARATGLEAQWGSDISLDTARLAFTKLQLEPAKRIDELRKVQDAVNAITKLKLDKLDLKNGLALTYSKSAEDVVANYLMRVREWLVRQLRLKYPAATLATTPIDLVVTVPATWSGEATARTLRAFDKAGFNNRNADFKMLRRTVTLPEPEAAALHTFDTHIPIDLDDRFQAGDYLVVCDAGGGTVDLISYQIRKTHPKLETKQVGLPTGGRFGASHIDREFLKWLEKRLGKIYFERLIPQDEGHAISGHTTITADLVSILEDFEALKLSFEGNEDQDYQDLIALPRSIQGIPDDPTKGIQDGNIKVTKRDLIEIFSPITDAVVQMIEDQVDNIEITGEDIGEIRRYVFLSGGFGCSKFLQREVDKSCRSKSIKLRLTSNPWLAVVLGAVTRGVEHAIRNPPSTNNFAPLPPIPYPPSSSSSSNPLPQRSGSRIADKLQRKLSQTVSQQRAIAEEIFGNQGAAPEDVRACAELIRKRYRLQIEIYTARHAINVELLERKKDQAKNTLQEIQKMTRRWQFLRSQWTDTEWVIVEDIGKEMRLVMSSENGEDKPPAQNVLNRNAQTREREVEEVNRPKEKGKQRFSFLRGIKKPKDEW